MVTPGVEALPVKALQAILVFQVLLFSSTGVMATPVGSAMVWPQKYGQNTVVSMMLYALTMYMTIIHDHG